MGESRVVRRPLHGLLAAVALAATTMASAVGYLAARLQRESRERAWSSREQAALREVATLVARGAPESEVFESVTRKVGRLCGADLVRLERYEADESATVVGEWSRVPAGPADGARFPVDGPGVARQVRSTGVAARTAAGATGASVGCPVDVDGRLWGMITAFRTAGEPFDPAAESQIGTFAEFVAPAIGNCRRREETARLADEQAALRRVATLVARGAPPQEVFDAVSDEITRLLEPDRTTLVRFEPDGTATFLAGSGWRGRRIYVGRTLELPRALEPLRVGRVVRVDDVGDRPDMADIRTKQGVLGSVGCPIVVDGRVWGVLAIDTRREPFHADTEQRMAGFTELVATAIANTEKQHEITRLLDEQAALRRVATQVAREVPPDEIIPAVADEIAQVLGADALLIARLDPDGRCTIVAQRGPHPPSLRVGERWTPDPSMAIFEAVRTGRPAYRDGYAHLELSETSAEAIESTRARYTIALPITVDERVWGALAVARSRAECFPAETAKRLESFNELLATAVRNTRARSEIVRLLDEQTALLEEQATLRRLATVVAHGAPAEEVFDAAAEAAARLFDVEVAFLIRGDSQTAEMGQFVGLSGWGAGDRAGVHFRRSRELVEVLRKGHAVRLDDVAAVPVAAALLEGSGVRAVVASPINLAGRAWGAFVIGSRRGPLPAGTEERLGNFAELVRTAIANAESRAEISRLLQHQAALRRVATLVARETPPEEIFQAVADEIGQVFGADVLHLVRLDDDGGATVVARMGEHAQRVGERYRFPPGLAMTEALRAGRPARRDHYGDIGDEFYADAIRQQRLRSGVAIPILVGGRTWGTLGMATRHEPFPARTEQRLADFTELIALAIGNADNRAALHRLLDEQAALRRLAVLVARGPSPLEVCTAVAEESRRLLGLDEVQVVQYEPGCTGVLLVTLETPPGASAPGTRFGLDDLAFLMGSPRRYATLLVWRTGRPARVDSDRLDDIAAEHSSGPHWQGIRSVSASPIAVDGRLWGSIIVTARREPLPADTEERMTRFAELVAMAIGNAETRAELAASRARIVAASDEIRRRIERDLHDGAQQRLVAMGLELRLTQSRVPEELPELRADLGRLAGEVTAVLDELREMARGIHPAILSEGGVRPALRTLARRSPVPVELDISTDARYPQPIEVAAYYVVSEALANAAKHAGASYVDVSLGEQDGVLHLSVRDDGVGGADPQRGSGLVGLRDRVEAVGGTIVVESPSGAGTTLLVTLPIAPAGA